MGRLLDWMMGRPRPVIAPPEPVKVERVREPEPELVPVRKLALVRAGRCRCGRTAAMTQKGPGEMCLRCIMKGPQW